MYLYKIWNVVNDKNYSHVILSDANIDNKNFTCKTFKFSKIAQRFAQRFASKKNVQEHVFLAR